MKIFIDTANIEQIKEVNSWGILDGVTTNPSLVSKEGRPFKDLVAEICRIVPGPISAECVAVEAGAAPLHRLQVRAGGRGEVRSAVVLGRHDLPGLRHPGDRCEPAGARLRRVGPPRSHRVSVWRLVSKCSTGAIISSHLHR